MKNIYVKPSLLVMAVLVGACSSMPKTTSMLDQSRSDYQVAQSNPKVANYASVEMRQAGEALDKANIAANQNESIENIDKLAYIAKQKIALTQEVAKQKSAEADVANSSKERDQVRLDQRSKEVNQARMETRVAQGDAAQAQAHAAKLEQQLADLSASKTDRGLVITFGDVLFGVDQARLNSNGMLMAQKVADVLQQNPERNVMIEGFADSTGSTSHNQELSERRATAVYIVLKEMGVASGRASVRGYGESYPVAANDTKENRQLNRRVEIILSDTDGKISSR